MGKQINQSIVIDAKIKTTLEGMNDVVSKLNKGLREGTTKIDLTKGVGNSISKYIETFKTEYSKFAQLTKNGKVEFGDTKDAIRSGEQMIKTFSELKRIVGNFEDMSLFDAKKMFPEAFNSKVDSLGKKLNALRENIISLDSKKIELEGARQALNDLTVKQQALQKELSEQFEVKINTETAEQNLEEAKKKISELREELKKELSGKMANTGATKTSLETRRAEILNARKTRGVTSEPLSGAQVKAAGGSKEQQIAATAALKLYNNEKAELKEIEEALKKNTAAAKEYRKALTSADSAKLTDLADKAEASEGKINEITEALKRQEQAQIDLNEANERRGKQETKASSVKKELDETTRNLELQEQKVNKLQVAYNQLITKTNPQELTKAFQDLGIDFTPEMVKNEQAVRQLQEQLNALDEQDHQKLIRSLQEMGLSADNAEDYVRQLKGQLTTIDDSAKDISRAAQEMENLKNQVLQFFSITNTIQLFKRAVTSALNTVKELDATMTEAAVVTDFSVGDMWDKLPIYSKEAQKLGVSINGMYQATTLYYQQGLKTNEAMALGVETMKMARIASMDSTEATKAMTAALRGFNMELNETSATRVNDVYSQLAAVTAADTNQIATAMSKTASIAASANMEFETTAALLAQIIETTQEAPETAGTAMKTIIARFSEVKSLRKRGETTGKDEEGETIDVNKIQTALRSVGISMEGFFAGTEGLDSILLKLAEKWGTLDVETKRYIATMAAGSRQQSRFLAMMSDYGRTMELVSEAENSAGASQKQFEKTQDSLATSLTRLKNAYDQFLMSLANNEILKFGIDLLTKFIETVNKMIDTVSGNNGLAKSLMSLVTVIAALKSGSTIFGGVLDKAAGKFGYEKKKSEEPVTSKNSLVSLTGLKEGVKTAWSKGKERFKGAKGSLRKENLIGRYYTSAQTAPFEEQKGDLAKGLLSTNKASQIKPIWKELTSTLETKGMDAAIKKAKEFGLALDEQTQAQLRANAVIKQGGLDVQKLGGDLQKLGGAALGVGSALSLLSGIFESMGLEEAAEVTQEISQVIMIAGVGLTTLGQIMPVITALTGAQAAATWAWLAPLLAIVAVVTVIIGLFSLFGKKKTLEQKLEKINKQIDAMKNQADEAKQKLEELENTIQGLNKIEDTLEGLTKGTIEWKKAIIENNEKVLELIKNYSILGKEGMVTSKDGRLIITDEGYNAIQEQQLNHYLSSRAATLALQNSAIDIEKDIVSKNKNISSQEKENKLNQLELQKQLTTDEFFNIVSQNDSLGGAKYVAEAAEIASLGFDLDEMFYWEQESLKNYGKNELYQMYADAFGKSFDDVKKMVDNKEITKTDIINTLAGLNLQTEQAKTIGHYSKIISQSADKDFLNKMFSKEGKGMRASEIEKKFENGVGAGGEKLIDYLASQGIHLSPDQLTELLTRIENVKNAFSEGSPIMKNIDSLRLEETNKNSIVDFLKSQDYGTALSISEKLALGYTKGATEKELVGVTSQINAILAQVDEKDRDVVAAAIAGADWESIPDLNATFQSLIDSGLIDESLLENLGKLNTSIQDLTNATYKNVDVQKALTSKFELKDMLKDIEDNGNSAIAGDVKDKLVNDESFSEEDFIRTGTDEWVYRGNLSEALRGKIKEKDAAASGMLAGSAENYQKSKKVGEVSGKIKWNSNSTAIDGEFAKMFGTYSPEELFEIWAENRTNYTHYRKSQGGEGLSAFLADAKEGKILQKDVDHFLEMSAKSGAGANSELDYQDVFSGIGQGTDYLKEGIITREQLEEVYIAYAKAVGEEPLKDLTYEGLVENIQRIYNTYGNTELLKNTAIDSIQKNAASAVASSDYIGQYQNQMPKGLETEYMQEYEAGVEAKLQAQGGEQYAEQLAEGFDETAQKTEGFDTAIKALASDLITSEKKMQDLNETIGEVSGSLVKSKRGTAEYSKAWGQVMSRLESIYGKDALEGIEITQEQMEELASGSVEAFQEIDKQIGEKSFNNLKLQEKIDGEIDNLTLPKLQATITPYMDVETLNRIFGNIVTKAGEDAEKARAAIADTLLDIGVQIEYVRDDNGYVVGATTKWIDRSNQFKPSGGGGGGGGSKWENPYDEFYNTVAKINEELRTREKIELRYQRLLDRHAATAEKLAQLSRDQITSLEAERADREYLLAGRERQMRDIEAEYSDLDEYARYNEQTRQVEINWDLIEKLDGSSNEKLTSRIEEYISKLEEQEGMIEEEIDALDEIQDAVWEIYEQGKEDYLDLEDQIKEAIIGARQREIDKLSEINESINDTNSKLIDSMQKQIDQYRQNRENERTEEEISDKQRRLAYLQQDTSGANALEIMKLQEEIDKAQEDYTDTLIDQKISELQDQNDQAAEQRQRQIDIMQAQLDKYEQSGQVWQDVHDLMDEGLDPDKGLVRGSQLATLLMSSSGFEGMSHIQRMDWLNSLEATVANGLKWLANGALQSIYGQGAEITFKDASGGEFSGTIDENGNVIADGQIWSGKNFYVTSEGEIKTTQTSEEAIRDYENSLKQELPKEEPSKPSKPGTTETKKWTFPATGKQYSSESEAKAAVDAWYAIKRQEWVDYYNDDTNTQGLDSLQIEMQKRYELNTLNKQLQDYYFDIEAHQFKTGGLADFTGPAWLDGTKSRPEYVLNADQTKSFFQLVDVLSSLRSGTSQTTQNSGDNTYDIDINVESIGSDYDVEQLADTIKRLINEDARYRSNNSINLMR